MFVYLFIVISFKMLFLVAHTLILFRC